MTTTHIFIWKFDLATERILLTVHIQRNATFCSTNMPMKVIVNTFRNASEHRSWQAPKQCNRFNLDVSTIYEKKKKNGKKSEKRRYPGMTDAEITNARVWFSPSPPFHFLSDVRSIALFEQNKTTKITEACCWHSLFKNFSFIIHFHSQMYRHFSSK